MNLIIDGRLWLRRRLAFLHDRLEAPMSEGERAAILQEIDMLSKEVGLGCGGRRSRRLFRR